MLNEYEPDEPAGQEDDDEPQGTDRADFNESGFRERVRYILGLDWSARDETILEELRRLKALDGV